MLFCNRDHIFFQTTKQTWQAPKTVKFYEPARFDALTRTSQAIYLIAWRVYYELAPHYRTGFDVCLNLHLDFLQEIPMKRGTTSFPNIMLAAL